MNKPLQVEHPFRSLLLAFIVVAGGFTLLGPAVGMAVAAPFYPGNLLNDILNPAAARPEIFQALMIIQGTAAVVGLILLPLMLITVTDRQRVSDLLAGRVGVPVLLAVMLAGICLQVILSPVAEWNLHVRFPEFLKDFEQWARQQENTRMELTRLLTTFASPAQFVTALLVIAVLPGVGEELVFRGIVQNRLHQLTANVHVAVWLSAVLFSAIHLQFFGFVPRLLLGAFFGYLYYLSGNLAVPVFAHFMHNAITLLMIYLFQLGLSDIHPEEAEPAPLYMVIVSTVVFLSLMLYLRKLLLRPPHEVAG
jgi:membrane protease YdiL (CAAX protease family)